MRIFRVAVRGRFADLDDDQRARLRADADAHDVVSHGAFTEAGTLTYEPPLHTFTFRYQLRTKEEEGEPEVCERALALARAELAALGVAHDGLRARATDMADMWTDRR